MSAILLFVGLLLFFAIVMFTPLNTIILRFLYKNERITPCSSTAQNNVTLFNEYNGVKYAPISVEPVGDGDEYAIRVESLEAPYREAVLTVVSNQFKHDPIKVIETGMPYYRIVKREFVDNNFGVNDEIVPNSTYTKKELGIMSKEAFKEKTKLEGEIAKLKANTEESVNSIIEHSKDIQASKYNPNK